MSKRIKIVSIKSILITVFLLLHFNSDAFSVTWCHDYTLSVIGNRDSNKLNVSDLRSELANRYNYKLVFTIPAGSSAPPQGLECGDVLVIGNAHSGLIDAQGRFDSYLQPVENGDTKPIPYPRDRATNLPNFKQDWSLQGLRQFNRVEIQKVSDPIKIFDKEIWMRVKKVKNVYYPYRDTSIEVWRWDSANQKGILDKANKSIKECKFNAASLTEPVDKLDDNNVEICFNKNFKKEVAELQKKAKGLKAELDELKKANTKAADDITNCKFSAVETALKPFISNVELKECKVEIKTAKELSEKAKKLKQVQEEASKTITKAQTDILACNFEIKGSLQQIAGNAGLAKCSEQVQAKSLIDNVDAI